MWGTWAFKHGSNLEPEQMPQSLSIKSEDIKQEQMVDNSDGRGPETKTNTLTIDPTFKDILNVLDSRNKVTNATHYHSAEGYKWQEMKADPSKNKICPTSQPPRKTPINKTSVKKNKWLY